MLQIPCPVCGVRDEAEFRFGGESHISRPGPGVDDKAWSLYLFYRENPMGMQHERWCHSYGCRQWFNVARDTVSHDIVAACAMWESPPGDDQ